MPSKNLASAATRLYQPQGLQDMLLYRLNRLRAVGGGMVLRYCEGQFGVTRREWVMLALLSSGEAMQPSDLAARAELNRSATSKAITAMVHKRLIERRSRPGDRRIAEIRLTEAGHSLYEQILPIVESVNRELMALLDVSEIAMLNSVLERMQRQADQMSHKLVELPRADRRRGGARRIPALGA